VEDAALAAEDATWVVEATGAEEAAEEAAGAEDATGLEEETGQTVVLTATTTVVRAVEEAGQLVTVGAQLMMVLTEVL